ncbi:MgtC/SapB family protein [Arcobacter vandammei]|uniref:MgtC/SapB family protein n=1 Tax=Arcobacter vandammei TaxID=2782243 RepID=UPI0018DFCE21|nr:DUF4010 domain-containing protein [Arcobacter vandammei]
MNLNDLLTYFIPTLIFSFLIGLEVRAYITKFHENDEKVFFGTTRTYTFLGILGFILYELEPNNFSIFIIGFISITFLYSILFKKLIENNKNSIVLYMVSMIVYSFGPLVNLYPLWLSSLIFVILVFLLNSKDKLINLNLKINIYEFETFGKILLLSAVVLPLLPNDNNIPYLGISLYKVWLTVVVIAIISYISYIIQKYIFPSKGIFLMGLLGGLYSSTATVIVISKKALNLEKNNIIGASIFAAILMMYVRVLIISYIFNFEVAKALTPAFIVLILVSLSITLVLYFKSTKLEHCVSSLDSNPLELKTAFVFAILFMFTMLITNLVIEHFGMTGLKFLSILVGFTDINPFILSLLTAKYSVTNATIVSSILVAIGSNNILIAIYSLFFGKDKTKIAATLLILLGIVTILVGFIL